jgi:hypothetical protein
LNENNFSLRTLYPAKLSFKINRAIKIFQDKQKLKTIYDCQASIHYRKFYKEFYTQKTETNKTMTGQEA